VVYGRARFSSDLILATDLWVCGAHLESRNRSAGLRRISSVLYPGIFAVTDGDFEAEAMAFLRLGSGLCSVAVYCNAIAFPAGRRSESDVF